MVLPFSYTQIFFAKQKWFALLLIAASFIDPVVGIAGLLAVMITNVFAWVMGYDRNLINDGIYAFNSLLVGLGIGVSFQINIAFFLVLFFASIFTFLVTVWLLGRMSVWGLPIGSIAFFVVSWIVILSTREFREIQLSEREIYVANNLWKIGGQGLVNAYDSVNALNINPSIALYLKSLGAIIFQYNLFAGLIIAVGLLLHSRIAFILSLLGFYSGWFFYKIIGGSMADLEYGYIGFNFILTAIAVGGFFMIPSFSSYLLVIILTPINALLIAASVKYLGVWQLPVLSVPFNIILLLVIYAMKVRMYPKYLQPVSIQRFSPEKNLYHYKNSLERFSRNTYYHIALPFWGEWNMSQGYEGKITHKGDWAYALDFDIVDEHERTFKMPGRKNEDYYCFKKPVLAPADGWIEEVIDHIEDNEVGNVNLENNWGNTVIIRHGQGFYSKLSHLMQYSILYPKGTFVKKGDLIAYCGSSGRSPEPHLHFQLQTTPYIASRTLKYPLAYYISRKNSDYIFNSFTVPQEKDQVSNVAPTNILKAAYSFVLGSQLHFECTQDGKQIKEDWEVMVDIYNATYLYCKKTGSKAWFVNDGTLFYFTAYEGSKKALLYYFYLGSYKILQGYYKSLALQDQYPLSDYNALSLQWIDDIVSPFFFLKKSMYDASYVSADDEIEPMEIIIKTSARVLSGKVTLREIKFDIEIRDGRIDRFVVYRGGQKLEWKWRE